MSDYLTQPRVDVRRAADRHVTNMGWLDSKQSFSFGGHRDFGNTHHGVLLVSNDDTVLPGTGFDTHPHRDMEIVTWVLDGSLVHKDSEGNSGVIYPGLAQRMSAGTGILHSERNDSWRPAGSAPGSGSSLASGDASGEDPVRFLQMWVVPDERGITPSYEQLEVSDKHLRGGLMPIASGMDRYAGESAIRIKNRYATMHVARLVSGQTVEIPEAPWLHLFVAQGRVELEGAGELSVGDSGRFTAGGGHKVAAAEPSEIVVWEMHATIR